MQNILIIYASKHGHTGKIAARIAQRAEAAGASVELRDVEHATGLSPEGHDAVVVGGSVHAGRYEKGLVSWAKAHSEALNAMPSAFFSVCLTAADDTDEARSATARYIESLIADTGWHPTRTVTFAGALQYREYDFATRLAMRLMMKHSHHPSDTSKDHDFTDWEAVDRFGSECAALVGGAARRAAA